MIKYLYLAASGFTVFELYGYFAGTSYPSRFIIGLWGVSFFIYMLSSFLTSLLKERLIAKAAKEYNAIVEPIKRNINLTDDEKKERIQEALTQRVLTKLSKIQGEKQ